MRISFVDSSIIVLSICQFEGIFYFKFPERFLEISCRVLTSLSTLFLILSILKT